MTTYIFTTPVVEEGPTGGHRLFYFFKLNRGVSVVKSGSSYYLKRYMSQDEIDTYDKFYQGGLKHSVTEVEKAALIAGGIGVTEANFVAE